MDIKVNTKDNTVEYFPQNQADAFALGDIFAKKTHTRIITSNNQNDESEMKIIVGVWEIWRILNETPNQKTKTR